MIHGCNHTIRAFLKALFDEASTSQTRGSSTAYLTGHPPLHGSWHTSLTTPTFRQDHMPFPASGDSIHYRCHQNDTALVQQPPFSRPVGQGLKACPSSNRHTPQSSNHCVRNTNTGNYFFFLHDVAFVSLVRGFSSFSISMHGSKPGPDYDVLSPVMVSSIKSIG